MASCPARLPPPSSACVLLQCSKAWTSPHCRCCAGSTVRSRCLILVPALLWRASAALCRHAPREHLQDCGNGLASRRTSPEPEQVRGRGVRVSSSCSWSFCSSFPHAAGSARPNRACTCQRTRTTRSSTPTTWTRSSRERRSVCFALCHAGISRLIANLCGCCGC